MVQTLPLLTRQQLGRVFTDQRTLLAIEAYFQQLANGIPTDITGLQTVQFVTMASDPTNAPNARVITAGANVGIGTSPGIVTISALPSGSSGQLQFNNAGTFSGGNLSGDVATSGALVTVIATHAVTNAKFRQSAGLSVVGNTTSGTADVTDITASLDGQVLRRSGSTIGFGALNLASANAVTGTLPAANLPASGVTPGSYSRATITVDAAGRVTVASSNPSTPITSSIPSGSAVALTSNVAANVTSITLAAGNWLIWGNVVFSPIGITSYAAQNAWIGTVSATFPTPPNGGALGVVNPPSGSGGGANVISGLQFYLSLGGTTTVYLSCQAGWAGGSMSAYGFIGAMPV